jgi:hypothetical protein
MSVKRVKKSTGAKHPKVERERSGSPIPVETTPVLADPTIIDNGSLDEEVTYYLANLALWHEHEGQHVLIHGREHFGFFPTRDGALNEGFRRFGRVAFLVREIRHNEGPRPLAWTILSL